MSNIRHFYGLSRDPFPQNINIKDLYHLPSMRPMEERVMFSINQKAISIITGDVGSGKSTSLRYVASKCHDSEYHKINIIGGNYSLMELYRQILLSFGISFHSYQISIMFTKIRELIREIATRKVIPLLIIDEAHLFRDAVFAQLHTLLQFEYDSSPIMPMILCGQETLIDKLMSTNSRPLASRVLGRTHLEALNKDIMEKYLLHHLQIAGCKKKVLSEESIFAIHQGSGGILRKANSLAKAAMIAAVYEEANIISAEHVRIATTEIFT